MKKYIKMFMAILMVFSTDISFSYKYTKTENSVEIQYNSFTDSIGKSSDKIRNSIKKKWDGFLNEIGRGSYKESEDK